MLRLSCDQNFKIKYFFVVRPMVVFPIQIWLITTIRGTNFKRSSRIQGMDDAITYCKSLRPQHDE